MTAADRRAGGSRIRERAVTTSLSNTNFKCICLDEKC